ncbi:hypothetical protein [Streptomyces sp. NPDC092952]|uniref:hypothetical protein n=1 Tax=Streptomyces sp. NPDC092952 TaxID=3366018 RepID=UPI0037FB44CC
MRRRLIVLGVALTALGGFVSVRIPVEAEDELYEPLWLGAGGVPQFAAEFRRRL